MRLTTKWLRVLPSDPECIATGSLKPEKQRRMTQVKEITDWYLSINWLTNKPHFAHMAPARMWQIIQELDRKPKLKPETRAAVDRLAAEFIEYHSQQGRALYAAAG